MPFPYPLRTALASLCLGIALLPAAPAALAQTGSTGIGTTAPHASAALDVSATNRGLLVPRLTQAQRDAIAAPATGLQIFNTTTTRLNFWDGERWQELLGTGPGGTATTLWPSTTFSFTGGPQTYTVPPGVTSLRVTATGAAGGGFTPPAPAPVVPGGAGSRAVGVVAVVPGEVLTVQVGGMGTGGFTGGGNGGANGGYNNGGAGHIGYSGGGGGATDLRRTPGAAADRLLVGAGGGGSAADNGAGPSFGGAGDRPGVPIGSSGGRAGAATAGGAAAPAFTREAAAGWARAAMAAAAAAAVGFSGAGAPGRGLSMAQRSIRAAAVAAAPARLPV